MALIIEDGSGKPDAQAYVSVAEVNAYAALYGLGSPVITDANIMRATQFLEGNYFTRWIGLKRTENQALSWPRGFATRRDGWNVSESIVPKEVKDASCALAIRANSNPDLMPDISRSDNAIEEQIGPIRVRYAPFAQTVTIFRDIEIILRPIVSPLNAGKILRV
jgi:hypothetical protein